MGICQNLHMDLSEDGFVKSLMWISKKLHISLVKSFMYTFRRFMWLFQNLCVDLSEALFRFVKKSMWIFWKMHIDFLETGCGFFKNCVLRGRGMGLA